MVSRVFSGKGSVAPASKQRILEIAQRLGYMPNAFARGLSQQKSGVVGVLMGQIDNHFYPKVLEALAARLQKTGRQIMFFVVLDDDLEGVLMQALQYRVEAVIATSMTLNSRLLEVFSAADIPVILFNRALETDNLFTVVCDNFAGGYQVAQTLIRAGYESFAYIGGDTDSSTNLHRRSGFSAGLAEAGLELNACLEAQYSYAWGEQAARAISRATHKVEACFCASDLIAFGALDAFRAAGLQVPEDIAVVGFDDVPAASWASYRLSTVRQPIAEMVEAVIALLEPDGPAPRVHKKLPPHFVQRASSRTPG